MSTKPKADSRFNNYIYLQAQNAGLFLGQIAHPLTGEKTLNLKAAHSVIDALEMLQEKTKGNLTRQEHSLLEKALNNIKNLYNQQLEKS